MNWKLRRRGKPDAEAQAAAEFEAGTVAAQMGRVRKAFEAVAADAARGIVETGRAMDRESAKIKAVLTSAGVYGLKGRDAADFDIDPVTGALSWSPSGFEFWIVCQHLHLSETFSYGPFVHRAGRDLLWSQAVDLARKIAFLRPPVSDPWSWFWTVIWDDVDGVRKEYAVYVPRDGAGFAADPWSAGEGFADMAAGKFYEREGRLLPEGDLVSPKERDK